MVSTHALVYDSSVATNLETDDKLLNKAKRLGRHKTKRAAENEALVCCVRAIATRLNAAIFTMDHDFHRYSKALPIVLHSIR